MPDARDYSAPQERPQRPESRSGPGQQRPATPPQWQQDAPARHYQPPQPQPGPQQYPSRGKLPPAFPPGYQGQPDAQGYYPPPQPPYGPPPRRKKHTGLKVLAGIGGGFLLLIVIAAAASPSKPSAPAASTTTQTAAPAATAAAAGAVSSAPAPAPADTRAAGTVSELQALAAAQGYLGDRQGFSRQGLIDQLDSPSGNGFSVADATWAVDHSGADWDAQAVESAKAYMSDGQGFSRQSLIDQMTSAYGSKFTQAQATYAANKIGL